MKTIAQLRKIVAAGMNARDEIDAREDARLNRKNAKLVGACQKYRNSYGHGSEGGPWWLFRRILSVDGNRCRSVNFQLTSTGRIEIETNDHDFLGESWLPVTESEWTQAWEAVEDAMYSALQREGVK